MLRLIVSDFDGTLLPYESPLVSERTLTLLHAALEKGIAVAISSGRTVGELTSHLPTLCGKVWLIGCDGAHYVKGNREYYGKPIAREDLLIFQKQAGNDFSFVLHGASRNYSVGMTPRAAEHFHALPISRVEEVGERIYKITSYGKKLRLTPYCGLRMHWDGGEDAIAQYVNRFADKGTALSDLQMRLMLTKFETACMGDSGNDVAMMHNAKYAVCIGQRSAALHDVCNLHYTHVEDALADLIANDK